MTTEVWRDLAEYLRTGLGFEYFNFLAGLDWMPSPYGRDMDSQVDNVLEPSDAKDPGSMETGLAGGETRFQVFGRVHDVVNHRGITVKTDVPDSLSVPSWLPVYRGANWHEREAAEMFGIEFEGHPNLTKLYLPDAFEGFPLRKSFPLLSREVKPWPGLVDVEDQPSTENVEGVAAVQPQGDTSKGDENPEDTDGPGEAAAEEDE